MIRKDIEQRHQAVCAEVFARRLKPALDELERLVRFTTSDDYYYQLETYSENYKTLLRYAFDGYRDPQQDLILNGLCVSIISLADEIRQHLLDQEFQYRRYQKTSLQSEFGNSADQNTARIEAQLFNPGQDINIDRIFKSIWLSGKTNNDFVALFQRIIHSSQIEWHEKALIVSALTLSLLNYFDKNKMLLLIEFVEMRENQVYQRALTGLLLALIVHDKRVPLYPALTDRLKKFSSDENLLPEVELVIMQLLLAKETDKITREFEDEVLPEMKKMMPKIEDKLQLNEITEDEDAEGKNPGWKDMIEEVPGLFEKIEKFSKMQMEGGDVFMSTFKLLKRFDFFNTMSNWFIPFHVGHPEIHEAYPTDEIINTRLLESLEKAFYICNSDKYSFALNFRAIPDQQRTMIVTNFEAEFAQMKEMASEEQLLDQSLTNNAIFIQYIQDLYRFFKLFPSRHEFDDVFQRKIRLSDLYFYKSFFQRPGFTEKLASFHFDKEHYPDAIAVYEDLLKTDGPSGEYFERTGYCYQKSGKYQLAIEAYKKAELFDGNRLWLLKKIGFCYLKIKDYQNALPYFRDAAQLQPDDLKLQLQVGQCYLNLKDYPQALHQYLNARFFAPDNLKVLRPIAYCQFILGKPDQANEIYAQILSSTSSPSAYDMMNAANVRLCLDQRKEAINLYRQCFLQKTPTRNELIDAFDEDAPYLVKNGISPDEIPLIRDYLIFQTEP